MKKEGIAAIVLRMARSILLTDVTLAVLVGLICFLFDLRSFEAYGTVLVWTGAAMIIFGCFTGIGGFAARAQDAVAFSLSGAGEMIENLQRISDARLSNLGCFVHLLISGMGLIALGYLVQAIPYFL